MSLKTWITHPAHPFDSFYYYDTDTLGFVRIRLELGRTDSMPDPGVFAKKKRYVGFITNPGDYKFRDLTRWTVNEYNEIVYTKDDGTKETLSTTPTVGKNTVDFSLTGGLTHPTFVHLGNKVVNTYALPKNSLGQPVTETMLRAIAQKVIGKEDTIILCAATASSTVLGDAIYFLYNGLVKTSVLKDTRSMDIQLSEAHAFFNNEDLIPMGASFAASGDDPYADKDGLVEFIVGTELVNDPVVMEKLTSQKKIMVGLVSVVTDYVNRYSAAYGEEYKTDAELWQLAISKLPLMSASTITEQSYIRHIRGVEIAVDFVQFILDVVTDQGAAALNKFSEFLQKQGDALRFGVTENKDYYNTITVGVCVEIFKVGNQVIYTPKIKQYRVNFDRSNSKWSGACASYEYVDINFNYRYAANLFDYEALEDPEIKKAFDDFMRKQRKAQIEDASTFFNDDFPPKKS